MVKVKQSRQELIRVEAECWLHRVHYTLLLLYMFKLFCNKKFKKKKTREVGIATVIEG